VRLFIAIAIPDDIRSALAAFVNQLRPSAPYAKWVRPENLHVTLKFLGHTDASNLGNVKAGLQRIRNAQPVSLEFRGLGFFPNEKRPRVFWTGMEFSSNLPGLATNIDHAMHELGFPLEDRPFTPHLTLARFDPPGMPANLAPQVKQNLPRNFGALTAGDFSLVESKLKSTGAEYTTVQSFRFVAET
jgi:2'-5' RNA ligase